MLILFLRIGKTIGMEELLNAVLPFLESTAQPAADAVHHPNPAEGPQQVQPPQAPAPEPAEVQELKRSIHARIKELVRQYFERKPWSRRLSVRFPEQDKVYDQAADDVMEQLEIDSDRETESLRAWEEAIQRDQSQVKSFIRSRYKGN